MKIVVAALVAFVTWCGLLVGIAVGAAFGALVSMSTLFCAFLSPQLHQEMLQAEHVAANAVVIALRKMKEAYAQHEDNVRDAVQTQ